MNEITRETRLESYISRPCTRRNAILQVLDSREMTARQIAYEMGYSDLNAVKPRLTELMNMGLVETAGKALDMTTNRTVAVYRRKED